MSDSTKPLVLIGATPIYGHIMPMRAIAKQLVARGYEVTFVSSSHYRKFMEEVGCEFVTIEGYGDFYEADLDTRFGARQALPQGPAQLLFDLEHVFVKVLPSQHEATQKALKLLTERHPGRPVLFISEGVFQGGVPTMFGAPGIKPTATLGVGLMPMVLSSVDCAPFGPGLPPDSTPEGQARNIAMAQQATQLFEPIHNIWYQLLEEVGGKAPVPALSLFDAPYLLFDRFIQMCPPSAEYPRSDAPSTIRFGGALPKGSRDVMTDPPVWWNEVVENKEKKDIVFVTQGTVSLEYNDVIIPTLNALKNRENTLVVAALGKKGATLPNGTDIPANARVLDFLHYDEILPYSAAFVTNGGYGGFQHSIANGAPIIAAGSGEDKPEVAARAEWSGMGINLKTGKPTQEAILAAVDEAISNPKYKIRAKEMEAEMAKFDPIGIVIQNLEELTTLKHLA